LSTHPPCEGAAGLSPARENALLGAQLLRLA
jgi:hypothetical protein